MSQNEAIIGLLGMRGFEDEYNYGRDHKDWIAFLEDFTFAKVYVKVVNDFIDYFKKETTEETSLEKGVVDYVKYLHGERKSDGALRFKATEILSTYSALKKFFRLAHYKDLDREYPVINALISQWLKTCEPIVKAKVFAEEELLKFLTMQHTPETLIVAAYAIIDIAFEGR